MYIDLQVSSPMSNKYCGGTIKFDVHKWKCSNDKLYHKNITLCANIVLYNSDLLPKFVISIYQGVL